MISIDPTLARIRLLESKPQILVLEAEQPYDEFVREVQAFYNKNGADVSYDLTYKIIDALGIEKAETPEGVQFAQEVKKNPQKLLTTFLKRKGVTIEQLESMVQNELIPSGNKQMVDLLTKMLQKMEEIEANTSGTRSTTETMSADVYKLVQGLYTRMDSRKGNKVDSTMTKIYTGEVVNFLTENGELIQKATVLIDADDDISQEQLDAFNKRKAATLTESKEITVNELPKTVQEVKSQPNILWAQKNNKIYIIDKSQLISDEEAAAVANRLGETGGEGGGGDTGEGAEELTLPREVKSLIKMPEMFFSPIGQETKQGEYNKAEDKTRKNIAHGYGQSQYYRQKADQIAREMGFSAVPEMTDESGDKWETMVNPNAPAYKVLNWIANNFQDSGIKIIGSQLTVSNGTKAQRSFTNAYVVIHFERNVEQSDITNIDSITVQKLERKQQSFLDFCKSERLNTRISDNNVVVNTK
ncbi:MAG: hypothetical protein WC389_21480 [Lutibacter sp.]|jgi:hypothetical protein